MAGGRRSPRPLRRPDRPSGRTQAGPRGEYLYRGKISFGDHLKFGSPSNFVIKDEFLYVILEDEQGKQTLAKYRIRLPQ